MKIKPSDKTAIIYKDKNYSYRELINISFLYSKLIKERSASRVAIFSENRPEWIFALLGCWNTKNTVIPIDHLSTAEEAAYIIKESDTDLVFLSNDNFQKGLEIGEILEKKINIINFDEIRLAAQIVEREDILEYENESLASIVFTSGTTGSPKGVMLSFENLYSNIEAVSSYVPIFKPNERTLVMLPLHHTFPFVGSMLAPLYTEGICVFTPSLNSEDIINTLKKYKVTVIIGVPRFYSLIRKGIMEKINSSFAAKIVFSLAKKVNSQKFSKKVFSKVQDKFGGNIKYLVSGGASLDREVEKDLRTLGFDVLNGYGMTECAPMITFTRPGKFKIGSAGNKLFCNEIRIKDEEILTKGPNVMMGYYGHPKATSEILIDGWLYTGDTGYVDDEGYLFITGRKKETIVLSNGKNINPEEVENALMRYPEIKEAGVFEFNDSLAVVIRPELSILMSKNEKDYLEYFRKNIIIDYNSNVSSYKQIKKIVITEEDLPRTRLSKLKRFMLPAFMEVAKPQEGSIDEPELESYKIIKNYLESEKGINVFPQDHLDYDISLDSLDKVSLVAFIKSSFGIEITDKEISEFETVIKLAEYIHTNKTKSEAEEVNWSGILKEKIDLKLPKSWITHYFIKFVTRVFFGIYFRIQSNGINKIPSGPFIIVPNHQSFFDGMFVTVFLKYVDAKRTYFYAKEKHLRLKILKFIANKHNVIAMDVKNDLKESIQKLAGVIRNGKNVMIFPEGTRSTSGEMGSFKKTFAILSKELNVPIVPVAITGADKALPKGKKIPRPFRKIQVRFLDPVYPENMDYDSLSETVRSRIAEAVKGV